MLQKDVINAGFKHVKDVFQRAYIFFKRLNSVSERSSGVYFPAFDVYFLPEHLASRPAKFMIDGPASNVSPSGYGSSEIRRIKLLFAG